MDAISNTFGTSRLAGVAQTVNGAFEQFLDKEINISRDTRMRASTSHNHLREFLEVKTAGQCSRILSEADADFLGGSFARHSKIWPLDDIDIFFPLDGHGLIYSRGGGRAPYTVLSDGVLSRNPLLEAPQRWMEEIYISSRKLIDGFKNVLAPHYPATTRVRRAGEAVNVETTEFGFDIVPCFSLRPNDGTAIDVYVMPDGNNGWIETNPRIDTDWSAHLQEKNNKLFRPAVKLVKMVERRAIR
jgi:hypothetical protein